MELFEKKLEGEIVFDGKVMTVHRDKIELSNGDTSFREVVEHSGGVVILASCLENNVEKILMVKQYRYPIQQALLELPAGKLEKGEDPFGAAKRELVEETGFEADDWQNLGFIHTSAGYSSEKLYLYKAKNLRFVGERPDDGEILKNCKYSKDEVINMITSGEITDAKTICAMMKGLIND
ncbi:NUDIX hydrolase [bacterium]|nr:NUDIX hydrolase [bacterium]